MDNGRVAIAITSHGITNVKSIYAGPDNGDVGFAKTFTGDILQQDADFFGDATISVVNGKTGLSTVTSPSSLFPEKLKLNDLLAFSGIGNDVTFARVTAISGNEATVTGITTVTGVASGQLPLINSVGVVTTGLGSPGNLNVSDLRIVKSAYEKSSDNTLYTETPKKFINDIDLTNSVITIRKSFDVTINHSTDSLTSVVVSGPNETFLPFDEERYSLVREDGVTEVLTSDRFSISIGSSLILDW